MYILHVNIHVKPDQLKDFITATKENALKSSSSEQGVVRFDVMQQVDDPTRFVLIEVYRSQEDASRHKETAHYNTWKNIAEPMMAEPRTRVKLQNIIPDDSGYSASSSD